MMFITAERVVIDPVDFVPVLIVLTDQPASAMEEIRHLTASEPRLGGLKPFYGLQLHCLLYTISSPGGGEGCTGDEIEAIKKAYPRKQITSREWAS